jgi:NADH-quinone oxidoreductase subunit C
MTSPEKIAAIQSRFQSAKVSEFRGQTRMFVAGDSLYDFLTFLKEEQGFDFLADITCVDYLNYRDAKDRFGLVYILVNTATNDRITVRTFLSEPDLVVPSVVPLWEGANWLEREVWDMFGITFDGHPDHRRILLPEEFSAFPLRKDYPLQGRGERHNFQRLERSEA